MKDVDFSGLLDYIILEKDNPKNIRNKKDKK